MTPVSRKLRLPLVTAIAGLAGFWGARAVTHSRLPTGAAPAGPSAAPATLGANASPPTESEGAGAPGAAAPPPASAQLAEAAQEKDFFRRAAKMFDAIERLSAEDFAWYAETRSLPPAFEDLDYSLGKAEDNALPDAFVERWLAVDPAGAVATMVAMTRPGKDSKHPPGTKVLRKALARARPVAFLAAGNDLPGDETKSNEETWPWEIAFTALAKVQPDAAHRLAAELPAARQSAARQAVALGIAEVDPLAAIRITEGIDNYGAIGTAALRSAEKAGLGVLRQVLQAGGQKLGRTVDLGMLYARHPELVVESPFQLSLIPDFRDAIGQLFAPEIQKRLAAEEQIPEVIRPWMVSQLAEVWAMQAPVAAVDWTLARYEKTPTADAMAPAQMAYSVWRERDWPAAMARWQSLPASDLKVAVGNQAAIALTQRGDAPGALKIYQPKLSPDDQPGQLAFNYIINAAARADPARTADWLVAQPEALDTKAPLARALAAWTQRDGEAAAAWVEDLPDTPQRDRAAAALAAALAPRDPDLAGEWIDAIGDAVRQGESARAVFRQLSAADPPAARAWLRALKDLAREEIESWIRLNR